MGSNMITYTTSQNADSSNKYTAIINKKKC